MLLNWDLNFLRCNQEFTAIDASLLLKLQSGAECLRSFLLKVPQEVLEHSSCEGQHLSAYIVEVVSKLIEASSLELACYRTGRLCIAAMHKLTNMMTPQIDFILRCALAQLQRTETSELEESLISIFAFMFVNYLEPSITFLSGIPGPEGESAMGFLMKRWLYKKYYCFGKYERNIR